MVVKRLLPVVLAVLVAGVAALAVNLLLVDYASSSDDPVGKLRPRASLTGGARTAPTTSGPTTGTTTERGVTTTEPTTTTDDDDEDDDDGRGRGRNRGRGGDGSDDDD